MKQTAVQQLEEYLTISLGKDRMRLLANEFEKAKAMEKEQIIEAYYQIGKDHQDMIFDIDKDAQQYYKETYESNT